LRCQSKDKGYKENIYRNALNIVLNNKYNLRCGTNLVNDLVCHNLTMKNKGDMKMKLNYNRKVSAGLGASVSMALALTGTVMAQDLTPEAEAQIVAIQSEKASRTPTQKKLDSQLNYLSREVTGSRAVAAVPALQSRVKREIDGTVLVDIAAAPSAELAAAITAAGGTVVYESPRWKSVRAKLPPSALLSIADRSDVKSIRRGRKPDVHTGSVVNEADGAQKADVSRPIYGVDGTGIKVGVISDSCDLYTNSVANGELPNFTVLPGRSGIPASGEGTAMSEIVADIAPGAHIYFAEAGPGIAGFADSILMLRSNGCHIIVDDISYSGGEWQFQDDVIAQAINEVVDDGAVYLSSAGNEGNLKYGTSSTWEGDFEDGGAYSAPLTYGRVHSFGSQNYNTLTNGASAVVLQWSDEYNTSANDYDLFILNAAGDAVVQSSTDTQDGDDAPIEYVSDVQPGERIVIVKDNPAEARYLRVIGFKSMLEVATAGQTIGHAGTAKCICVGASDAWIAVNNTSEGTFSTNSMIEKSSSDGPHRMFYKPDGTPFTPGDFLSTGGTNLITPAITGGDGGATSVPGFEEFFGTSAAAPACAAVAALVWSRDLSQTGPQIRAILESSCLDIEDPGIEVNSGHGTLMADQALTQTLTPQDLWRQINFSTYLPDGTANPTNDPDSDGIANLMEYATGGDPNVTNASPLVAIADNGALSVLSYQRNPAATDTTIGFVSKTNLTTGTWTDVVVDSDAAVSTNGSVVLRAANVGSTNSVEFFRLKVSAQ
jgi:hypothetical protein